MPPEPQNNQPGLDPARLTDTTIREIVHLSLGGSAVRIHLSNAFGTQPLRVESIFVARAKAPGSSAIDAASMQRVLFNGAGAVFIPSGAEMLSDPIALDAPALGDLAISFHLTRPPAGESSHPGARATTFLLHGDHTIDPELATADKVEHWYQLSAVDVAAASPAATTPASTIVAFGDSITDGHASTTDANTRWPDFFAARLHADPRTRNLAIVNEGIGGNHLLTDNLGPNALARMDRDVLAQSGVKTIILLMGINDLGTLARGANASPVDHAALIARMISAYQQIVWRAHAHGIKVVGCTLTPWLGNDFYKPARENEADRVKINEWIRHSGTFDALVDFDAYMHDPLNPASMLQKADSGDHLHPGPEGYRRMADFLPIELFY